MVFHIRFLKYFVFYLLFFCLNIHNRRFKSWKRRWFILNDNCLYYFECTTDKVPRGIIPLENILVRIAYAFSALLSSQWNIISFMLIIFFLFILIRFETWRIEASHTALSCLRVEVAMSSKLAKQTRMER